jgi:protoporphyrinogen oxidase
MIGRFGPTLAEAFFRSYVEKLYGRPWNEIAPDFARALTTASQGAIKRTTFPYPSNGTGAICEGIARQITTAGSQLRTNSPAQRIALDRDVTVEANGTAETFDHVISTLPLPVLARCLPDSPPTITQAADNLTTRSTVLVYLDVHGTDGFPELWRYVYDARYRMGRVANIARWWPTGSTRPAPPNQTIFCVEYWCTRDDETWNEPDDELATSCEHELRASRLLDDHARVDAHHVRRVPSTHPVPAVDAHTQVEQLQQYFASLDNLSLVGRHAVDGTSDVADNLQAGAVAAHAVLDLCRRS